MNCPMKLIWVNHSGIQKVCDHIENLGLFYLNLKKDVLGIRKIN